MDSSSLSLKVVLPLPLTRVKVEALFYQGDLPSSPPLSPPEKILPFPVSLPPGFSQGERYITRFSGLLGRTSPLSFPPNPCNFVEILGPFPSPIEERGGSMREMVRFSPSPPFFRKDCPFFSPRFEPHILIILRCFLNIAANSPPPLVPAQSVDGHFLLPDLPTLYERLFLHLFLPPSPFTWTCDGYTSCCFFFPSFFSLGTGKRGLPTPCGNAPTCPFWFPFTF